MKKSLIYFSIAILITALYLYGNEIFFSEKEAPEGVNSSIPNSYLVKGAKNVEIELKNSTDHRNENLGTFTSPSRSDHKSLNEKDIAETAVYDEENSRVEFSNKIKSYIENSSQLKINAETEDAATENRKCHDQILDLMAQYNRLATDVMDHKISLDQYKINDEKIRNSLIKIASLNVSLAAYAISENFRMSGFYVGEDNVIDSIAWGMIASAMGHPLASDSCHSFIRKCTENDFANALGAAIFYSEAYGFMNN